MGVWFPSSTQPTRRAIALHLENKREKRRFGNVDFGSIKLETIEMLVNHLEYTHYNPVLHGLVLAPKDWQYSSFTVMRKG